MKKLFTFFALAVMSFVAAFAAEEEPNVLKVTVMDETKLEAVEGAIVSFFGKEQVTGETGQATIEILPSELTGDSYSLTVYKDGYKEGEAPVKFNSWGMATVRVLLQGEEGSFTVKVVDADYEPIAGAFVTFQETEAETAENGEVVIKEIYAPDVIGKTVPYTVYKDGYEFYEGEADFTEGFDASAIAILVAAEASLSIKVTDADYEPIAGAFVYLGEKEYETNESGEAFIDGFNAPDVIGKTVAFSVYKDGYVPFEGEAEFDMLEAQKWVQLELQMASLNVIVTANEGEDLIEGAMVTFNDNTYFTDETGKVTISGFTFLSVMGTKVPVTVYKDGYDVYEAEADFTEGFEAWVTAELTAAEATLNIKVMAGEDPVAGAYITYDGKEYYSDEMGSLVVKGIYAPAVIGTKVPVTVYKDGYIPFEGEADFTETIDAYLIAELEAEKASFTVKVIAGEDPVEGATVTFDGKEYTTDANGEVKVTDLYAPALVGKTVAYTVYKDGYAFFEGEADFTEGFDAFSIAELAAEKGSFTVKVIAGEDPVEGATVTFDGKEYTTDANGEVKVTDLNAPDFVGKTVPYTVYKDGYAFFEGEADFTEGFDAFSIAELAAEKGSFTVKVIAGEEPVEGATVTFLGTEYTTDANGEVKVTDLNAPDFVGKTVPYTVYKDGYAFFEGEADFTETMDAYEVATLEVAMASLTVKVVTGEENDPVEGATVTFNGEEYITDANGEVKIIGINALEVLGKTVAYTVYKDGYAFFESEADFTETMDAYEVAELAAEKGSFTVKVIAGEEPVEGATVTFYGNEYITDANGEVKVTDLNAPDFVGKTVPYTVYKDGYEFFEGEADFTEGFDAFEVAELVADMASLTVKVMDGEDPVEGATVTFLGTEYTTDAYGEVKISGLSAPEVIGQTFEITVTKEGYEVYEGVADFSETMEAWVVVELIAIPTGIDAIISDIQNSDAKVYDLNGRRVVNPQSGRVYIINGQKVLLNR